MKKTLKIMIKGLSFIGIFLLMAVVTLYSVLLLICYGPSVKARNIFVTTFLETGALKFVVGLVLPDSKVQEVVNSNSLKEMEEEVNTELIDVNVASDEIEIHEVSGSNFYATMMIVHDPSKVTVATTYPFSEYGKTLDQIVKENDAIGGVNGGIYQSTGNKGGYPMGTVVSNGKIVWNSPYGVGYHLVGFDENNILRILSISGMSPTEVENLVKTEKIRDAVTFQEEASDANNHFVKLIVNGEKREANGLGSGANPRTAIGQREDGAVLLLVTDGRGASGHLGATANDLIEVMEEYGAVNAANIDGGSSSTMYYKDEYLMTSVTLYYSNSSWRLPEAFIVSK
ncbi:MAG: phosphodiester glycosidase family protein [Firmicutes bacterium]|nr:phosphodiester glycosidase family protein [Bacillota bacterium]